MERGTVRTYDPAEEQSVTVFVAEMVAEYNRTTPERLPPLADVADPDAINALFGRSGRDEPALEDGKLTFRWTGTLVTLRSDGTVELERAASRITTPKT